MHESIVNDSKVLQDEEVRGYKERTQDLRVLMDNYLTIDHYYDFKKTESQWSEQFKKD